MKSRRYFLKTGSLLGLASFFPTNRLLARNVPSTVNSGSFSFAKDIEAESGYDVIIAGGGMAGSSAAIAAGRLGARVLLLEATATLGGMGTSGLVNAFDGMADGEKALVGGIMREIVETLYEQGGLASWQTPETWRKNLLHPTRFNPEALKRLLDKMVVESGAEVRFLSKVVAADTEKKRVKGIIVSQQEGLRYIPGKCFIDATGDAHLSVMAGAEYQQAGRDTDKIMPPTLCSLWAGIDFSKTEGEAKKQFDKAVADHLFTDPDEVRLSQFIMSEAGKYNTAGLNGGHIFDTDAVDTASYTRAMIKGRKLAKEYETFLRRYVPGYEKVDLATTASLLGVRESRRIIGEYTLKFDDLRSGRHFADQIGVFNKEVDIHLYKPDEAHYKEQKELAEKIGRLGKGQSFGLPYGILVPKGWENLWVAGRCVSTDVLVHGATRVMPSAAMMGQAAGTAAVQCIGKNEKANHLNVITLIKTLRNNGAILPQQSVPENITID